MARRIIPLPPAESWDLHLPSPRQAAFLFLRSPEKLRVEEQETLVTLRQTDPEVDLAYDLVQQFAHPARVNVRESTLTPG